MNKMTMAGIVLVCMGCHNRAGGLNNRILLLVVLEAGKFKVKVPARWVSFCGFFSWLRGGAVLLWASVTSSWCAWKGREGTLGCHLLERH